MVNIIGDRHKLDFIGDIEIESNNSLLNMRGGAIRLNGGSLYATMVGTGPDVKDLPFLLFGKNSPNGKTLEFFLAFNAGDSSEKTTTLVYTQIKGSMKSKDSYSYGGIIDFGSINLPSYEISSVPYSNNIFNVVSSALISGFDFQMTLNKDSLNFESIDKFSIKLNLK